jgi:hypothetical protein
VVVFPFAFYIAVQQPFKPLWSRLLLYELEPSRASIGTDINKFFETNFMLCDKTVHAVEYFFSSCIGLEKFT